MVNQLANGLVGQRTTNYKQDGEGFVRFALVADEQKIEKAVRQIGSIFK